MPTKFHVGTLGHINVVRGWRKSAPGLASRIAVQVIKRPLLLHPRRPLRNAALHAISLSHSVVKPIMIAPLPPTGQTGQLLHGVLQNLSMMTQTGAIAKAAN